MRQVLIFKELEFKRYLISYIYIFIYYNLNLKLYAPKFVCYNKNLTVFERLLKGLKDNNTINILNLSNNELGESNDGMLIGQLLSAHCK